MTREDALTALQGTWSFEMRGTKVLVNDLALLGTIRSLQARDRRPGRRLLALPGGIPRKLEALQPTF
ncbi:MAG TPA: hypothetical protein VF171_03590 [Trueperaceae bacterium]